ncbi:hypothetical protein CYQ88_05565 [Hydrogenovibrio sp. SC-1]|uniref:copper chaperone PCu(A)C n=1 Tax=Hydrogenovibrio sp. SC-1 TaxID=2065820 RepID=UPI000C79BC0B|nr:copper chaperone PCu(A)C [Hydrogenovibrio sp. SC-1]PLA74548.1 hypothetical protein CYQ88_05565 [Hydrogenovibrio sp. SC-1]
MKKLSIWLCSSLLLLAHFSAHAQTAADAIEVDDAYVRIAPPNALATAAFMELENESNDDHALVSAKTTINQTTELHTHINDNGVMKMRQVSQIDLPADQEVKLQPGGFHIMLIGLNAPIQEGQHIQIELKFEDGSTKTISAKSRSMMKMDEMNHSHDHEHHH